MATQRTKGRCRFCGAEYTRAGMSKHLASCSARREASEQGTGKGRPTRLLHLLVSGRYAPDYWIHIEVPANATLDTLDDFLRDMWLECCGHMSAFTIDGVSYASVVDPDWGMDDKSMNVKLGKVLEVGQRFQHEYDFGSTTYLQLQVVSEREGRPVQKGVQLLARNDPPSVLCDACKRQEATQICTECAWEEGGWLCDQCSKTHACGEDMFLPVVNSPRVGVCGYTG